MALPSAPKLASRNEKGIDKLFQYHPFSGERVVLIKSNSLQVLSARIADGVRLGLGDVKDNHVSGQYSAM
jgi:hypothetical protein